jgi:hypothetical protein
MPRPYEDLVKSVGATHVETGRGMPPPDDARILSLLC